MEMKDIPNYMVYDTGINYTLSLMTIHHVRTTIL